MYYTNTDIEEILEKYIWVIKKSKKIKCLQNLLFKDWFVFARTSIHIRPILC